MSNPQPGVYVFDMGQNFSGWARLRVAGPRGTAVRLRFAELLYDNGMINQENLRGARAEDVYILKGEGEEIYEPRFTYHGFRYVEVTGFPGVPTAETIRGRVVHSGVAQTGSFACSKPILNGLQRIITWGQKTNLHSVPTDCDQRDERMGWMGDAQGTAEEAIMNFDMAAFYTNFLRDIRDVQDEKGQITDTVPHIWGSRPADPAWGTAYPLIAWYMYRYYGDTRILAEHYDGLKAYVEFPPQQGRERPGHATAITATGWPWTRPREPRLLVLLLLRRPGPGRRGPHPQKGRRRQGLRRPGRLHPEGLPRRVLRSQDRPTTPTARRRPTPCRFSSIWPRRPNAARPGGACSTTSPTKTPPT